MSSIIKGINSEAIDSPNFDRQVKNITRMNPKGSAAEKMILNRFLSSPMYNTQLHGKDFVNTALEWLQRIKVDLTKKFPDADLSDLEDLAHKMYEDYLARIGQLEESNLPPRAGFNKKPKQKGPGYSKDDYEYTEFVPRDKKERGEEWAIKRDVMKQKLKKSEPKSLDTGFFKNYLGNRPVREEEIDEATKAEVRAELDQAIKDFLAKGGQIEKLKPNKVRAKPGMSMASKHIGTAGEINRKTRSKMLVGKGRNIQGNKPVVNVEGYSAGASGGAGLGEKINTPGGMGQSYRKIEVKGPAGYEEGKASGILKGVLQEYNTDTIQDVVSRLPKGLTVNNFTIPAFKEYLYNKYYAVEKPNWKELVGHFAREYREKHGIKEYKLGDLNHFDNMLLALPKGLSAEQINLQGFKEFIYEKHGDKEWPNFKKNRFAYWDAYEKAGGVQKPGLFSKIKSSMGIDENLLNTYGDQLGLDEDVYTDNLYKEFLDSDYNKNQGSYIETLRNLGQFVRSKDMPEEKAKPIIRRLVAKLHPSGLNEEEMNLAELKCWQGYTRVRGIPAGAPGSCKKKTKENSIMKGIQNEYDVDSSRKIEFSKENPPSLDYLYQQFIYNMLSSTNKLDPKDWIAAMNNRYGLGYTWKDYQVKGHQDHTNNWDKIIKKYVLGVK